MITETLQLIAICGEFVKRYTSSNAYSAFKERVRMQSQYSYGRQFGYYVEPKASVVVTYALNELEVQHQSDVATHESNVPHLETNRKIVADVEQFMTSRGFKPTERVVDASSRKKYKPYITVKTGWKKDIDRIAVDDGFSEKAYLALKEKWTAELAQALKAEEDELRVAEKKKEEELTKRRKDMQLAKYLVKYNLPIDSEMSDVLDAVLDRDHNLRLAHAMLATRNDWNDGFDYVESAIHSYSPQNEVERIASEDLLDMIDRAQESGDIDGRIFRDCEYSYDFFFSLVDSDLMNDYNDITSSLDAEKWR